MNETRILMGMPVTVEVVDASATQALLDSAFDYFEYVDATFSTYKTESEISRINRGELTLEYASNDMKTIFALAEQTRLETNGYFDIRHGGAYDPSGVVKGWAIFNAATLLRGQGAEDFYVEAGGDIQMSGVNAEGQKWRVGIRNPFNPAEIIKVLAVTGCGVATSGTYVRGPHIYNPVTGSLPDSEIVSLTVIGPDVFEADCYATAAFAMGRGGIGFVEALEGLEGYMIDSNKMATFTSGFEAYVDHENH